MKAADVSSLRMLRRARDRIDRDYAGQIDIPALAAAAGYSREHFIRAFRAAYGETPGRYRTRRRVERGLLRADVADRAPGQRITSGEAQSRRQLVKSRHDHWYFHRVGLGA